MAVVTYIPKRRSARVDLHIAGAVVPFRLTTLEESGEVVMLAEVTDPAVLRACKRLGYRVFDDAPAEDAAPAVASTAAAERAPRATPDGWRYPEIVQRAFANGWVYADITGAGEDNQWGIEGGRGDASGLTMAELSLTVPPQGWNEKRDTHWPWEILGWKAPGEEWKAPKLPSKRPAADQVPALDEPPAPLGDEAALADESPEDEPSGADPDIIEDPPTDEQPPQPPETRNEEVLAGWPNDRLDAAVAALADVWRSAGKPPSTSKARHYLAKAGITPVTTEQVNALLDRVQTTI